MTTDGNADPAPRSRTRTYVLVLIVQAVTITALWTFGRYFGGQ